MRPIKIAAWIATGIFAIWFFVRLSALSNVQTRYGSPATSIPVVIGLLLACALIPGVLWIIVLATKKTQDSNRNQQLFGKADNRYNGEQDVKDPEMVSLSKQLEEVKSEIAQLQETYKIVSESLDQSLITQAKFDEQDQKIREEIRGLVQKRNSIKNRGIAIKNLRKEFENLLLLKEKEIITEEELDEKREELIHSFIEKSLNKN